MRGELPRTQKVGASDVDRGSRGCVEPTPVGGRQWGGGSPSDHGSSCVSQGAAFLSTEGAVATAATSGCHCTSNPPGRDRAEAQSGHTSKSSTTDHRSKCSPFDTKCSMLRADAGALAAALPSFLGLWLPCRPCKSQCGPMEAGGPWARGETAAGELGVAGEKPGLLDRVGDGEGGCGTQGRLGHWRHRLLPLVLPLPRAQMRAQGLGKPADWKAEDPGT